MEFSYFTTQMYFQTCPVRLSQQQQEQDKQIMVSGQCEAEASNQSIACEVEAIPIEHNFQ